MTESGDAHARWVEEALRAHEELLLRYATRFVGPDAARDVVQDAFLRLCEQRPADLDGRLTPWLYRVCRNRAMDLLRRGQAVHKNGTVEVEERASPAPAPPDAMAEERDTARAALAALATLPDSQQEVLRLRLGHGLAYRDIAEVTGLSVSHVGVLIHEGMKTLRRRLAVVPVRVLGEGGAR